MIESPVRTLEFHGKVERAIRSWQAQFRTMRHHFKFRLKQQIANDSAPMEWLIVWVADVILKSRVLPNGRTLYEIYTHHARKHNIVGF